MKLIPLGEVLAEAKNPVRVDDPAKAILISVKLHGRGAVRRTVGDGKAPKPFVGNLGRSGQFVYSRIWCRRGAMAVIPPALDGVVVTNEFPIFDVSADKLDTRYLAHYVQTPTFLAELERVSQGASGQNRVKEEAFLSLNIPLPLLEEQHRIAAVLDRTEILRSKRRHVMNELDRLDQRLFVEMFGDPIRNPNDYPQVKLGQVGLLDRGVSKHRPRNDPALLGGPYPLIQTGDVARSGGTITRFTSTYSELGLAQSKLWPAGTLCITIAANIAQTGILAFDACFPDSVVGFTADEATTMYVRTWLTFLQSTLEASAPQSAQRNINLAVLRNLPMPLPDLGDRREFAHGLDTIRGQRTLAQESDAQFGSLFASLQSRAFTGQL